MLERLSNDGAKVRIIFGICKFFGSFCQEKEKKLRKSVHFLEKNDILFV